MNGLWHAPGDWLSTRFSARDRRSIAMWGLIAYLALLPTRFLWKDRVWMVWLLSELAIVISLLAIVAAETPVEGE